MPRSTLALAGATIAPCEGCGLRHEGSCAQSDCRTCGAPGAVGWDGCEAHTDFVECELCQCLFPLVDDVTYFQGTLDRYVDGTGNPGFPGDHPELECPACGGSDDSPFLDYCGMDCPACGGDGTLAAKGGRPFRPGTNADVRCSQCAWSEGHLVRDEDGGLVLEPGPVP
jgi:hypothetical protein